MKRRKFITTMTALPVVGFFPSLFAKSKDSKKDIQKYKEDKLYLKDPDSWYLQEPPKTCDELVEMMEKTVHVGKSTDRRYSITGEKYKEYSVGMKRSAFAKDQSGCKTEEEVICRSQWLTFLIEGRKCKDPTLYWDLKPEYSEYIDRGSNESKIYMRYLVSDKEAGRWDHASEYLIFKDKKISLKSLVSHGA